MPVEQIPGLICFEQAYKCLKSAVCGSISVAEASGRTVGDHYVHASGFFYTAAQSGNPALHLFFGVLMRSVMIPQTSAEPEDAYTVIYYELSVDVIAAFRGEGGIVYIMIAVDVQEPCMAHRHKKGEI